MMKKVLNSHICKAETSQFFLLKNDWNDLLIIKIAANNVSAD